MPSLFDRGDATVALAGDWHGNISWISGAIPYLRRAGITTIYHVGDLGFWGEAPGTGFRSSLEFWLAKGDINLFCVPGNHENWDALDTLFAADPGQPIQLEPHLWMLPRGYRWTHADRTFVALGGAPSIDAEYRIPGKSWWASEAVTAADVARVAAGGYADIMLTHDAPVTGTEAVRKIRVPSDDPQFRLDDEVLAYAGAGAQLIQDAYDAVLPRLLVHGHYHQADSINLGGRHIYSMGKDNGRRNLATLDLATLDVEWLDYKLR